MYENDLFDAAVFSPLLAPRAAQASAGSGQASSRQEGDLDALIHQSMLDFSSLMAADKSTRVHAFDRGYRVELGNQRIAFDMGSFKSLLEHSNQGVDLTFSDDLASYQPEEGLVRKSKVPLWVLRPVGGSVVVIQRVW